jgi:hypothetical protein
MYKTLQFATLRLLHLEKPNSQALLTNNSLNNIHFLLDKSYLLHFLCVICYVACYYCPQTSGSMDKIHI